MKGKELLTNFFKGLLNPYSPLVTLVVGGLVSSFVNLVTIPLDLILFGLVIWFIIACFVQVYSNMLNHHSIEMGRSETENSRLNSIIEEKDRQIKNNVGLIEARYGEFSQYIRLQKLEHIFKKVVEKFSIIDGCHLYKYKISQKNDIINIKTVYECGYEDEQVNINVIKQKYYTIEKPIYVDFEKIIEKYNIVLNDSSLNIEESKSLFEDSIMELFFKLDKCQDKYVAYRIQIILLNMYKSVFNKKEELSFENESTLDLEIGKRTGILSSILTKKDHVFYYRDNKEEKDGRMYYSMYLNVDGDESIIIFTVNEQDLKNNYINKKLQEVVKYFFEAYNKEGC